ncbi:MAG: hypothetical protein KC413_20900, partial [Anaerolineales bacterium]|nr:hypothetical protein [Anaerolineales bacterium]
EGSIILLDATTCTVQKTFREHIDYVNDLAFNNDGDLLVSGSRAGTIVVNSLVTDSSARLGDHQTSIETVAFSPDGTLIASGDADGNIILWGVQEK